MHSGFLDLQASLAGQDVVKRKHDRLDVQPRRDKLEDRQYEVVQAQFDLGEQTMKA